MSSRDKNAQALRQAVIAQARFGRRCYFCHFAFGTTEEYELHHLDCDHTNDDVANLVPVCELCHAPFHLDLVGRKWPDHPGRIIFLPEMTQTELNNLLQAVFFAMGAEVAGDKPTSEEKLGEPHTLYGHLLARAEAVEKRVPGLSDPLALAQVLTEMDDATYAKRDQLLAGCRYLPATEYFVTKVSAWAASGAAFARLDRSAWRNIADVA